MASSGEDTLLRLTDDNNNLIGTDCVPAIDPAQFEDRYRKNLRGTGMDRAECLQIGRELGQILFPGGIRKPLLAASERGRVRLHLRSDNSRETNLPWELALFAEPGECPLRSGKICLVRDVNSVASQSVPPEPSRSVVVAWANPGSPRYPALDWIEPEAKCVLRALSQVTNGLYSLEELGYATPSALIRRLHARPADVVHMVCHGDVAATGSLLVLEGSQPNEEATIYADQLSDLFAKAGVRLAILSGCQTGVPSTGTGAQLVAAGVPTVIAMQFPIRDEHAYEFARAFYRAIAEGESVEEAVYRGRSALRADPVAWATPVLLVASEAPRETLGSLPLSKSLSRNRLPIDDRPFVGRAKELTQLRTSIRKQNRRLVTVFGMGGMGKTRLALRFAREAVDLFEDGVRVVECETLTDPDQLRSALAQSLGLEAAPSWEALIGEVERQNSLVVLDCFEHLVSAGEHIEAMLRRCPEIHVLVTSRVLLGTPSEFEFELGPMSLTRRASGLAEAIGLFANAASGASRTFALTSANRRLVKQLVQSLDAVPLAIILAAGRLRHLSLEELFERIQTHRLEVLQRKPVGRDRQSDLLTVVEDSLRLLPAASRHLIELLSVFVGSFTLDDAVDVLDREVGLLNEISLLRDNSLLSTRTVDGRMRYRMLDTVREAVARLADQTSLGGTRERHAAHYTERAREVRRIADSGDIVQANLLLQRDSGNFRAATIFAIQNGLEVLVVPLAASLARLYFEVGLKAEFERLADAAEKLQKENLTLLIEITGLRGALCGRSGQYPAAKEHWIRRADYARRAGDMNKVADAKLDMVESAIALKQYAEAESLIAEVEQLGDLVTDKALRIGGRLQLAKLELSRGNLESALSIARQTENSMSNIDRDSEAMYVWYSLAQIYRAAGSLNESMALCQKLLRVAIEGGYYHNAGTALLELSQAQEQAGFAEAAAVSVGRAASLPNGGSSSVKSASARRIRVLSTRFGQKLVTEAVNRAKEMPWDDSEATALGKP